MNKEFPPNLHLINRHLSAEILSKLIASGEALLLMSEGVYLIRELQNSKSLYVISNDLQARLPEIKLNTTIKVIDYRELVKITPHYNIITW